MGPEVYLKVLEHHLRVKDYKNFCERIHRWPVVYPLEKMIVMTKAEMKSWTTKGSDKPDEKQRFVVSFPLPPPIDETDFSLLFSVVRSQIHYLLRSLFKLHDFQNKFLEAAQVLMAIDPTEALDYFTAHSLWSIFSVGPEATTPLREVAGSKEVTAGFSDLALKVYRLAVGDLSLKGLADKQAFLGELIALNPEMVLQNLGGSSTSAVISPLAALAEETA